MAPDTSHQASVAANLARFNAEFALRYDAQEATIVLSSLFAKTLLEFNPHQPRKSSEESNTVLGNLDPANLCGPDNSLPDTASFTTKFPHSLFKPGMKLLDFACGTGLVTSKLIPYLVSDDASVKTEVVGMDINQAFLAKFDEKLKGKSIPANISANSYVYDVLDSKFEDELQTQFGNKFDCIICTISYHHIDNYQKVTKKLTEFLAPGGWILIIDFYNEDAEFGLNGTKPKLNNDAVSHMGGLRLPALNETLHDYCHLENVSAAREYKCDIWQQGHFIDNHCTQDMIDKFHNGELPSKKNQFEEDLYLVQVSIVMAVGQKL
ncbi:uncharacterized protein RJT21DRAFT_117183 [Scheffersomyces amazonensis]|uniref:uncharacterized protein n=1 Tax=Scheffersomyces amazonensis TaxID=1078765 RepID=UPI00315C6798